MTRINLIPVENLTKKHLIAEYREIPRISSFIKKSLNSNSGKLDYSRIPEKFKFGQGHIFFFYNKGKYLYQRYENIVNEMKKRGININPKFKQYPKIHKISLLEDWIPTKEEIDISKERIMNKIKQKPWLYPDKDLTLNMDQ